jgi:hypothetical protein
LDGDSDNTALQDSEQDQDGGSILGGDPDSGMSIPSAQGGSAPPGGTQPPPTPQTPPSDSGNGPSAPPKVSGRAMFLGNLLKTVLTGALTSQAGGTSGFQRAFNQAANPNVKAQQQGQNQLQQAQVQKAQSEADQAKIQTSITGMKALQYEYLLKRLPMEDQMKHIGEVAKFNDFIVKNGAIPETQPGDEKAIDADTMHSNGTDPRVLNHQGRFLSMPTGKFDDDGKPLFVKTFFPSKDVLQQEFHYTDANGKDAVLSAGMPIGGALGKIVEDQFGKAQNDTKEQHKQMGDALRPNVPDNEIPQTVAWLKNQQKQNTPLYQQNKNAADAQINTLNAAHGQIQSDKVAQARAGVEMRADEKNKQGAQAGNDALTYANNYISSKDFTGPGDEALLEKYFELAKPSSGFRMTKDQMQLLRDGRSWIEGAKAKAEYIEGGKLFSDTQRQQIANTMKMLVQAKGGGKGNAAPTRPQNVPAQAVWNPETRQWRLPQ